MYTYLNAVQEGENMDMPTISISVSVASSISSIPSEDWDLCAVESVGEDSLNPFLMHAFLSSLEDSSSVTTVRCFLLSSVSLKKIQGKLCSLRLLNQQLTTTCLIF